MVRTGIALAALLACGATLGAFEPSLDPRSLTEAVDLGQSRIDDARSRFHAPYHIDVMQPPVDYIEIVTPFRRVALDAEAYARAGQRLYGQREALATLGDNPSRVDVVAELTFHPLNNYLGVPALTVTLGGSNGATINPINTVSTPRFGPRVSGMPLANPAVVAGAVGPQRSQPLLGGTIVATFDGLALDARGVYGIVVRDNGKDVAKATVDLGRLR
jgi:hypothetical protein